MNWWPRFWQLLLTQLRLSKRSDGCNRIRVSRARNWPARWITVLGSEREGPDTIPVGTGEYGQKSFVDLCFRRCLFNNQQDVLNAVQVMRERAQAAGTLKTTPQQNVTTQGQTIIIEPANPQVVYVPQYDPWIVYGAPLAVYPGYIPGPWVAAPIVSF